MTGLIPIPFVRDALGHVTDLDLGTLPNLVLGGAAGKLFGSLSSLPDKSADSVGGGTGKGAQFPLFKDPTIAFNLLLGKEVDLFTYDMPKMVFDADLRFSFFVISLGGGIHAEADFDFGYDTRGLKQFAQTGDASKLLNGLYFDDHVVNGVDHPEALVTADVSLAIGLPDINIGIDYGPFSVGLEVSLGVAGGIFADVTFNLADPNPDGKVYFDEFTHNIERSFEEGELCVFDTTGEINAGLKVFIKLKLHFTADVGFITIDKEVTLLVLNDEIVEATETLSLTLTAITSSDPQITLDTTPANRTAALTITDNDSATVSLSGTTHGNETGPVSLVFTVTQSAVSSTDTVLSYSTGGDAQSDSDYAAPSGTVTIPAGSTTATITVLVLNDEIVEATETLSLTLTAISSSNPQITLDTTPANRTAALTITDNDISTEPPVKVTVDSSANGLTIVVAGETNRDLTVTQDGSFFSIRSTANDLSLNGGPRTNLVIVSGVQGLFVTLGPGDDRLDLSGTSTNNTIIGGSGNDTIICGSGNDSVRSGDGRDSILGGPGEDQLFGEGEIDTIDGQAGNDLLLGRRSGRITDHPAAIGGQIRRAIDRLGWPVQRLDQCGAGSRNAHDERQPNAAGQRRGAGSCGASHQSQQLHSGRTGIGRVQG